MSIADGRAVRIGLFPCKGPSAHRRPTGSCPRSVHPAWWTTPYDCLAYRMRTVQGIRSRLLPLCARASRRMRFVPCRGRWSSQRRVRRHHAHRNSHDRRCCSRTWCSRRCPRTGSVHTRPAYSRHFVGKVSARFPYRVSRMDRRSTWLFHGRSAPIPQRRKGFGVSATRKPN